MIAIEPKKHRMKNRYRLTRRGSRSERFYCFDTQTKKRTSLGNISRDEAQQLLEAKNNAERQPLLNLQIAKAYLAGTDSGVTQRTWSDALQYLIEMKTGANRKRWITVSKDKALKALLPRVLVETRAEELLNCVKAGTVSTNIFLRRLHNFCVDRDSPLKCGRVPWVCRRPFPIIKGLNKVSYKLKDDLVVKLCIMVRESI